MGAVTPAACSLEPGPYPEIAAFLVRIVESIKRSGARFMAAIKNSIRKYLLFLFGLETLLSFSSSVFAVLPPEEHAQFQKAFFDQINIKAELTLPTIKRKAFANECTAVYTVLLVHVQPPEFGLKRDDQIKLAYPCDEENRLSWIGSMLPWASPWPGKRNWMTVPHNYLKRETSTSWTLDNSGKVFGPVQFSADQFNCPDTEYPLVNEENAPSGEIYYDVQRHGIRSASTVCRYAPGQYELHVHWYLNSPAVDKDIACFEGRNEYERVKGLEEPYYQIRTITR